MVKRKLVKIGIVFLICFFCIYQEKPALSACAACSAGKLACTAVIPANHRRIRGEMTTAWKIHREWMKQTYFFENILLAMKQMTVQMTTVSMQQVKIIGTFFDAKHQLETMRLFQQLMAEANKNYQPSEGMCDITTNVRGLLASERKTDLVHQTLANRTMDRQLRTGENLSQFDDGDFYSRVDMFKKTFCSKKDNANGLKNLCAGKTAPQETINKDVDYTRTIESELTLEVDFSKEDEKASSDDEKATFALMANLFAHDPMPSLGRRLLADERGNPRMAAYKYMDLRAVAAKRSVAQNSINAIIAERAHGDTETKYAPFLKSVIAELGVPKDEIDFILGKHPSYFAQMEVLTKKLYQNPVFYTELYDKPTNVLRKRAAIRAINLMQDRDYYKSLLRSEAVLSVLLESMLNAEHDRVYSDLNDLRPDGKGAKQ